jgi:hypothetical protein
VPGGPQLVGKRLHAAGQPLGVVEHQHFGHRKSPSGIVIAR